MFRKLFCPLLFCLFCSVCGVEAQPSTLAPARKKAVYGTDYYVSPSVYDYTTAARAIVGDAPTDYEQAERLYLWLCAHVTYDLTGRVRTADGWKLVHFYPCEEEKKSGRAQIIDQWEMYNLNADPTEMHNLYGQPGTEKQLRRLQKELLKLQKQYDDPIESQLVK